MWVFGCSEEAISLRSLAQDNGNDKDDDMEGFMEVR